MSFNRAKLPLLGVVVVAAALFGVVACSSSDTGTGGAGQTGTVPDAGTSAADDTGAPASSDAGADTSTTSEAGTHDVALGGKCPNGDGDCESGHCISQGNGGGMGGGDSGGGGMGASPGSFCSVPCATINQDPAPECSDPVFTGKCSGKKLCQVK